MDLIIIRNATDRTDAIRQALRKSAYIYVAKCRWINGTDIAVTLTKCPSGHC